MGNRSNRKQTLKVKMQASSLVTACKAREGQQVDPSTCEIIQIRTPHDCVGCNKFRG